MWGNNFNTKYKKIIVDEIHNIFYRKSKEQWVSSKDIEFMVNTINSSYRLYNQWEESNDSLNIFIELIVKLEWDTLEFLHYDNDDDLMRKAYLEKFAKIFLKNAKEKIHEINDIKSSFQD